MSSITSSLIILFVVTVCESKTKSNIKTWNRNFDFTNADNWNLNRVPCSNDRIVFPENAVVYLDQEVSAKEIILPKNGRIVLGDKASISLVGSNDGNQCDGKGNDWFDPYNWNQTINILPAFQDLFPSLQFMGRSEDDNPIPHMERIPCALDSVVFPVDTSFKVSIDWQIKIKSLQIWDKTLNSQDFRSFVDSDVGQQLFSFKDSVKNSLTIDDNIVCTDERGCVCGNEEPQILSRVCRSVLRYGCPALPCSDPIRPVGHCCDTCASMLTFSYKPDFSFELVEEMIEQFKYERKSDYSSVASYLHKLKSDQLQFIAIDRADKGPADHLVRAIKQYFEDGPGIYSIQSMRVQSSTDWKTVGAGVWVAVIFLILLIVGGGIGAAYYFKMKSIAVPFAFARFHGSDAEDGVELRVGTTPHSALDPNTPIQISSGSVAKFNAEAVKEVVTFENPIFERHALKEKENQLKEQSSQSTAVDRPLI